MNFTARGWTHISSIGRQILYPTPPGKPATNVSMGKMKPGGKNRIPFGDCCLIGDKEKKILSVPCGKVRRREEERRWEGGAGNQMVETCSPRKWLLATPQILKALPPTKRDRKGGVKEGESQKEERVKEKGAREGWKERERGQEGKLSPWEFPLEIDEDTEFASSVFLDPAGAAGINTGAQRWKAQKRQLWDLWGL